MRDMILNIFLLKKAEPTVFQDINLWTPAHWLCFNNDKESLITILKAGGVFFTPDVNGYFPVDLAGQKVRLLFKFNCLSFIVY